MGWILHFHGALFNPQKSRMQVVHCPQVSGLPRIPVPRLALAETKGRERGLQAEDPVPNPSSAID